MPYQGDPAGSSADQLRFLVGDTVSGTVLLTDDEVDYLLGAYPSTVTAAYQAALALAAKFTAKADIAVGTAQRTFQTQAAGFREIAKTLAAQGGDVGLTGLKVGPPQAGGVVGESRSDGSLVELEMGSAVWENIGETSGQ